MHFACIMISPFLASVRAYNAWNSRETVTIRHVKFSVNTPDVEVYTRVAINFLILSEGDHASQAERRFLLLLLPFLSSLFFFFLLLPLYFSFFFFFFFFSLPRFNSSRWRNNAYKWSKSMPVFTRFVHSGHKCKWKWGKKTNCNLFIYAGPG